MKSKMIMSIATAAMAFAVLQAPAAEAKGKVVNLHKMHKVHVWKWHKWAAPYPYVPVGYADCSFYYWKWKHTGSLYWKSKYFVCSGLY